MEVVGKPDELPPVQKAVQSAIDEARGSLCPMVGVERFEFYDFAKQAYAVVQTGGAALLRLLLPPERRHSTRWVAQTYAPNLLHDMKRSCTAETPDKPYGKHCIPFCPYQVVDDTMQTGSVP